MGNGSGGSMRRNLSDNSSSAKQTSESKGLSKEAYFKLCRRSEDQPDTHSNALEKTIQEQAKEIQALKDQLKEVTQEDRSLDSPKDRSSIFAIDPIQSVGSEDQSGEVAQKDKGSVSPQVCRKLHSSASFSGSSEGQPFVFSSTTVDVSKPHRSRSRSRSRGGISRERTASRGGNRSPRNFEEMLWMDPFSQSASFSDLAMKRPSDEIMRKLSGDPAKKEEEIKNNKLQNERLDRGNNELKSQLDESNENLEQKLKHLKRQLEEKDEKLVKKDKELQTLKYEIEKVNKKQENLEQKLKRKDEELETLKHEIDEENKKSENLEQKLKKKDEELKTSIKELDAKDQKNKILSARIEHIKNINDKIERSDKSFKALRKEIEENCHIEAYHHSIRNPTKRLIKENRILEIKKDNLKQKEQGLLQKEQELKQKEQELKQKEQELKQKEQELLQKEQELKQKEQELLQKE
jgi:DNA repair exonuclease SbcCD ATPase subunit